MHLLAEALAHATANLRGLVIHNDAAHFSCGVNLGSILSYIENEDYSGLDRFLDHFQQTVKAMKTAPVPVVAAPAGLSLGGGFEVVLHTDKVIYHANSVTGLVETLVGVVPGGGGVKEMLYRWHERKGDGTAAAWETFTTTAYGKTAGSPLEAAPMAMFRHGIDDYVMNRDRLLGVAIEAVLDLAPGYTPKQRIPLVMPGRELWLEMQEWLQQAHEKEQLTAHDVRIGSGVAMIVTGGDVDAGTLMAEDEILALERKAFLQLALTGETKARIRYMLEYGSPLRN
jgi:3-hydroxyacyl-CoA dehydrogenase